MSQTNISFQPSRIKLLKLKNSKEYQNAFSKLKEEILKKGEYKPSKSEKEAVDDSKAIAEKYRQKGLSTSEVSHIESIFLSHFEYEIRTETHPKFLFYVFTGHEGIQL